MFQSYLPKKSYWLLCSLVVLIFSQNSLAETIETCVQSVKTQQQRDYTFNFNQPLCESPDDCWIQFQAPEDAFNLKLDNDYVLKLFGPKTYVSNEFFLLPIPANKINSQSVTFEAKDTNQDKRFQKDFCIRLGNYKYLKTINSTSWFFKTGAPLYSAYFLFLISIFLLFSLWLKKSSLGLSLLLYSVVLLSFSEYPRAYFDPVLATGGLHFPLRLLQDLCLVYVLYSFHHKLRSSIIIKRITYLYAGVIGIYLLLLAVGIKDYVYYSRIIIIMAPLVAAPMFIGTVFSFKLEDAIERKVLIPVSIILLSFQLNDLLVFWKLTESYFTVRLYIPFIVGMALFLYFRRMHNEILEARSTFEKGKIYKEFIHDLKSPLAVLRIFLTEQGERTERSKILTAAMDRIEKMVTLTDASKSHDAELKVPLNMALINIIKQKKIEYSDLKFDVDVKTEAFTFAEISKLERIFSNIINNAYESYEFNQSKVVKITMISTEEEIDLRFTDYGKGISKEVSTRLLDNQVTDKAHGSGIGLKSSYDYLQSIGGSLKFLTMQGSGTTIEMKFRSVQPPSWYIETFLSDDGMNQETIIKLDVANSLKDLEELSKLPQKVYVTGSVSMNSNTLNFLESAGNIFWVRNYTSKKSSYEDLDYVLIDDDKYIRMSWEYFAKTSHKKIKTFSNVQDFLEQSHQIGKSCSVYLDVNINGEKSFKYIDKIHELGFSNIILATGEFIEESLVPDHVSGVTGKLPPVH